MAMFHDFQLELMTETLRVQHDRKLSVPALRDAVAVIESVLIHDLLTSPEGIQLGRIGRLKIAYWDGDTAPTDDADQQEICLIGSASESLAERFKAKERLNSLGISLPPLPPCAKKSNKGDCE